MLIEVFPPSVAGTLNYILDGVVDMTFTYIGIEFFTIVMVVNLDGQAEGNPVPVNTIFPPFKDPLTVTATTVARRVNVRELVSPSGSSLILTLYAPDGTLGILKLALVALIELRLTKVF